MSTRRIVLAVLAVLLGFGGFFALRPLFGYWHPPYRPYMVTAFLVLLVISVAQRNWAHFRGRRH